MEALAEIKSMVERVVSEVLESRIGEIRAELAQRVEGELQPLFVQREGATALLNVAVNAIQGSVTQADILNSVLDGSTNFASRSVLFVVRGGAAVAWHARNMPERAAQNLSVSATSGAMGHALREGVPQQLKAEEILGEEARAIGVPADGRALLLPMKVREKVPAVLYADSGTVPTGRLDAHALQLLVRSAALWLEVVASRRQAPDVGRPEEAVASASVHDVQPQEVQAQVREEESWDRPSDAAIMPERISTSAVPQNEAAEAAVAPPERVTESAAALTGVAPQTQPPLEGDPELHKRARRFAKLLVDEIKLYNPQKVTEGREHRDLFERLRDDIEKSRAAYNKRYGSNPPGATEYFNQELVSNLAADDPAALGSGFRR
jgi:hypothetical protein